MPEQARARPIQTAMTLGSGQDGGTRAVCRVSFHTALPKPETRPVRRAV
ncbi:TPA: acyl-CoA dehydrogenase [Neisseria meningitidis]